MTTGIILGGLSLWLLPIALSLLGAVILSKLSGVKVAGRGSRPLRLDSPNSLIEPEIFRLARSERVAIKLIWSKASRVGNEIPFVHFTIGALDV